MSSTQKLGVHEMKQSNQDTRIALLEQSNMNINETLKEIKNSLVRLENKIDSKFDYLDKKIDMLDDRFTTKMDALDNKMDLRFSRLNARIWTNFYWGVGGFASVLGFLAHVMKWI